MKKVIHIPLHIYSCSVIIFVDTTFEFIKKWLSKRVGDKTKLSEKWEKSMRAGIEGNSLGFTFEGSEGGVDAIIFLRKRPITNKDHGVLYHEVIHAVDHIASKLDQGCRFYDSEGHSEARAYLYSHIVMQAQQEFWKSPNEKKEKKR